MPTQTISTFNGLTQTAGASVSLIISTSSLPTIRTLYGYINGNATPGAAQYWLQLFNQAMVPANASVPLASLQVLSSDGFQFEWGDFGLTTGNLDALASGSGWILCLSTTEAPLTIGTGGVTMDCNVDIDSSLIPVVGTLTKSSTNGLLTVWTEAQGTAGTYSKLISLKVTELLGAARFIQVFVDDSSLIPASNFSIFPLPTSSTVRLDFSKGITPYGQNGFYIRLTGCCVRILDALPTTDNSTIPPTVTYGSSPINSAAIKATYI